MKKTINHTAKILMSVLFCAAALSAASAASEKKAYSFELNAVPGTEWKSTMKAGLFTITKTPQYACWIAEEDGTLVSTIQVTQRSSKNKWRGSPKNGRPESLPVWGFARAALNENIDAASSATPQAGVENSRETSLYASLIPGKTYLVRFEINTSYDYNSAWPKDAAEGSPNYSGVNGQPSIIYEAAFTAGQSAPLVLEPAGTGSVDGSSGVIKQGLTGIDSAINLVKTVTVTVKVR